VNFLDRFSKNTQISNFLETRPVKAELLLADGRAEVTTLILVFRSFVNAPKTVRHGADRVPTPLLWIRLSAFRGHTDRPVCRITCHATHSDVRAFGPTEQCLALCVANAVLRY
jgi:hypothetical protein